MTPDLAAIEREFRAGQLSNREIGRQHGVSEAGVRKWAKAHGWTRDLSAAVRSRVRESLVRDAVRANGCELIGIVPSDEAIVDEAAARGVAVVRIHRTDIGALRHAVATLLGRLGEATKLSEQSRIIADLSQALARLVPLERVAWALDEDKDPLTGISDADLASMINALKSQLVTAIPASI